jgi:acyl-CoA synthetase (AMP-forming)/AMP-acid ligase II
MPIGQYPAGKLAVAIFGGDRLTFGELERRSAQLANFLRRRGLEPGDRVAALLQNDLTMPVVAWAARRSGLRLAPDNWQLARDEIAYVLADSDARAVVVSDALAETLAEVIAGMDEPRVRLTDGEARPGLLALESEIAGEPASQPAGEFDGPVMYYSSGTTGRPKGILRPLGPLAYGQQRPIETFYANLFGLGPATRLLVPAPLYFAAPFGWTSAAVALGATVVLLRRFDAEAVLAAIEAHRITHALFVPTHFVRLLRLPAEVRARYDLSSLESAVHAGAPCSADVKQAMIDWWGPCIHEYYSGSEGAGFTTASSAEWLARPGTVGRSRTGAIHILDDHGQECPPGVMGTVYFEGAPQFEYHKAPDKTASYFHPQGWASLGDMGWLDEDGYLYLGDRKVDLIISGGANIYPQEVEAALQAHPAVLDVGVIGVPDPEYGEQVKAIVQAAPDVLPGDELATALIGHCRQRLAAYKCPRSIAFVDALPRLASGKLLKRELRARFGAGDTGRDDLDLSRPGAIPELR